MANNKTITIAEVHALMGELLTDETVAELVAEKGYSMEEVVEKVARMIAQDAKKAATPRTKTPSKSDIANDRMISEIIALMKAHGEPVTTAWLLENGGVKYVTNRQKMSGLLGRAERKGLVTRADKVKGVTLWAVA